MIDKIEDRNDVRVVNLSGSLDISLQASLKQDLLDKFPRTKPRIIFDLKDVSFIDSACLGVLVALTRQAREQNGEVAFIHLTDEVQAIIQITRLDKILHIFENEEKAMAFLNQ